MLTYALRRLLLAIPTLLLISLVIFLMVDLAPGSPMSEIPRSIPPETRAKMIAALGADQPVFVRYLLWLKQFFIVEPAYLIDGWFGTSLGGDQQRILSWQSRAPVFDVIGDRLARTMTVVGSGYLIASAIALPIGVYSAYRQYSWFDQLGTFVAMIGYSVPTFFTGVLLIVIFAVNLGWFPSYYDASLKVTDFSSLSRQVWQMALPVAVIALFHAAEISRYTRSAMLDTLGQDYVRTARAKGALEGTVVMKHALRNAMIPVITVLALGMPSIFGGSIIVEQVFKINGIGGALIGAIVASDLPMVQTLTFIFAALIVFFNLVADLLYGMMDPRIRYD